MVSNMADPFLARVLRLLESARPSRSFVGGIVFKYQDKVFAFGTVPDHYRTLDPIPDSERAIEDRPGMDDILPVVRVHSGNFWRRLVTQRNLGVGESFIAGEFSMEQGSVWHMLAIFLRNEVDKQVTLSVEEKLKLAAMYAKWRW